MGNKIIAGLVFALAVFSSGAALGEGLPVKDVCWEQMCFRCDVALTEEHRARGLMFQSGLAPDQGMLFVFDHEGDYPFWMKNMSFPIDIIWLDAQKQIVHLQANVPPCAVEPCDVYDPNAKAKYVLEVGAGIAQKAGMKKGDTLRF